MKMDLTGFMPGVWLLVMSWVLFIYQVAFIGTLLLVVGVALILAVVLRPMWNSKEWDEA